MATHCIRQFPLHFPTRVSPCAITFQLHCTFFLLKLNFNSHVITHPPQSSMVHLYNYTVISLVQLIPRPVRNRQYYDLSPKIILSPFSLLHFRLHFKYPPFYSVNSFPFVSPKSLHLLHSPVEEGPKKKSQRVHRIPLPCKKGLRTTRFCNFCT